MLLLLLLLLLLLFCDIWDYVVRLNTNVRSRFNLRVTCLKGGISARERSPLILSTRAEANFTQLEKVSYPILNIKKIFVPPPSFSKMV